MGNKYTGKQIIKAGEALIDFDAMDANPDKFSEALDIMSYWRFSHEVPLEKAFTLLQEISLKKDKKAIFAKRLKRHISIVRKLLRFEKMKLKNMQDIGGCRVVLSSQKKLNQTVRELRKLSSFKNHQGNIRYKDYIKKPKEDGYRSYHIIGGFLDNEGDNKNIEIQLRTRIQHYWATALEIVDLFTDQALKSNQGDEAWRIFFKNVSEQFSIMDDIHLFDSLSEQDQHKVYQSKLMSNKDFLKSCKIAKDYCIQLDVIEKLNAFAGSLMVIDDQLAESTDTSGYSLLKINVKKHTLESAIFSGDDSELAEEEYIKAEKEASSNHSIAVALVSSTTVGDIREAYPNYFADSGEFLKHLDFISNVRISGKVLGQKPPYVNVLANAKI